MSKQDYETPAAFLRAVERRFGALTIDLACREDNAKAPRALTEEIDSLSSNWCGEIGAGENAWLNPPFADIEPWVKKASEWRNAPHYLRTRILLLVPASIGSNWFRDHVLQTAFVWALNGRLTFVGAKDPYPKDLMLLEYGHAPGFGVWDWRKDT